jgi:phosphate transport system substrate-binding protein
LVASAILEFGGPFELWLERSPELRNTTMCRMGCRDAQSIGIHAFFSKIRDLLAGNRRCRAFLRISRVSTARRGTWEGHMLSTLKKCISIGIIAAVWLGGTLPAATADADALRIGGTGAAMKAVERLGELCIGDGATRIEVIAGLGSSGGIRALSEGLLGLAVSGRPLRPEEAAKGLTQVAVGRSPFGLATSHPNPNGLKSSEIASLFASENPTWADGTPLRIILRPQNDSDTAILGQLFPGMGAAIERARQRRDIQTAGTDQDNATLAEALPGSLTGAAYTQIKLENRRLRLVTIDGVEPTLENFERGTYPYGRSLYFVLPVQPSSAARQLLACLRSPEGMAALRITGNLPITTGEP